VRTIETGSHTEYTAVGHVTNLAVRMQTAAPAGSSAASEATQRLREGYFTFRDLGRTEVKGLNEPINVYEVVSAGRCAVTSSWRRGAGSRGSSDASVRWRCSPARWFRPDWPSADCCRGWRGGRWQVAPDVRRRGFSVKGGTRSTQASGDRAHLRQPVLHRRDGPVVVRAGNLCTRWSGEIGAPFFTGASAGHRAGDARLAHRPAAD